ncbi:MAG: M16 family metallopeptidase, partial [Pseudomonadales bacterium]
MILPFACTPVSLATISGIAVVGFMGLTVAAATQYKAERVVLDNGVTVLLLPMPEADQVAIETIYNVGFVHEPKGMTQAAHLLEHLACNAATGNYKANEAMNLLNQLGMANAETLPSWTHYDYVLPANKLELALEIEAERLTSLKIDREIVRVEALRCYQETDFVERNPASGMTKHAFMALNQAWRHGMTSALVRGGLEDFSIEELENFHRAFYRPDNLTVVIIGGFNRDQAFELLEEHLGDVRPPKQSRLAAIDWSRIPNRTTVRWDAKVRAVCLAFPPPSNRRDQIALSLLGAALTQELMKDPQINDVANTVTCTNHLWS